MSNKKLITLFILLVLFLPLPLFIKAFINNYNKIHPNNNLVKEKIIVFEEINFSGKKPGVKIKSQLLDQTTALDLLKKTANTKVRGEKENAFVLEINGVVADPKKREFWAFFLNDKLANVGAGSYFLKNGDRVLWKITNY